MMEKQAKKSIICQTNHKISKFKLFIITIITFYLSNINNCAVSISNISYREVNPVSTYDVFGSIRKNYICKDDNLNGNTLNDKNTKVQNLIFDPRILNKESGEIETYKEDKNIENFYNEFVKDVYISCLGNGLCNKESNKCECFKGYLTYFNSIIDYQTSLVRCNLKLKYQSTALFYATLISFGALHFYLGNVLLGICQLIFFLITLLLNVNIFYKGTIKLLEGNVNFNFYNISVIAMGCFFGFLCTCWYLLDIMFVASNTYLDNDGYNLI